MTMNSNVIPQAYQNNHFQRLILKMVRPMIALWQLLFKMLSVVRKEIWLLEGLDPRTQEPTSVFYTGKQEEKHYFGEVFFRKNYTCRSLGNHWIWQILFRNKKLFHNCHFSVIQTRWQITRHIRLKNLFCIPIWIYGSVDLMDDIDTQVKNDRSGRHNLKRIKRNRFDIEVSRDIELFDDFYYNMFQAYIGKKTWAMLRH